MGYTVGIYLITDGKVVFENSWNFSYARKLDKSVYIEQVAYDHYRVDQKELEALFVNLNDVPKAFASKLRHFYLVPSKRILDDANLLVEDEKFLREIKKAINDAETIADVYEEMRNMRQKIKDRNELYDRLSCTRESVHEHVLHHQPEYIVVEIEPA